MIYLGLGYYPYNYAKELKELSYMTNNSSPIFNSRNSHKKTNKRKN